MSRKTAISLFSGAGGLDVGFEKAGFQILFANEFDHDAACTWRQNRPLNSAAMSEGDIAEKLPEPISRKSRCPVWRSSLSRFFCGG